jgi:hypothetical protein
VLAALFVDVDEPLQAARVPAKAVAVPMRPANFRKLRREPSLTSGMFSRGLLIGA